MTLILPVAADKPLVATAVGPTVDWQHGPLPELLEHLEAEVHRERRQELPRLMAMAHKVERVHAQCAEAPHGLHTHLESMFESLSEHMQKEEHVLFPMVRCGYGSRAYMPVHILRQEHREHIEALERTRLLCADFSAPAQACATWHALYAGLAAFETAMRENIALENQVLFPRVLRG